MVLVVALDVAEAIATDADKLGAAAAEVLLA